MDERWGRKQSQTNKASLGTASTSCHCVQNACKRFSFVGELAISVNGEMLSLLYIDLMCK